MEIAEIVKEFLLDPTWMSVWHNVTMQLLAKGEMGNMFSRWCNARRLRIGFTFLRHF
jgi:hypothetical protein